MQHIMVLGAGVVGVTTAWQLAQAGFRVTVIDRQPQAALETSFANGGQISVSHATPWANPQTPAKILAWLGKEDAPLLFRWQRLLGDVSGKGTGEIDWALWRWGWQFLWACQSSASTANLRQLINLGKYSRQILIQVREQTGIEYECLTKGILHFYTDRSELETALLAAEQMQRFGCDRQVIDVAQALSIEPALHQLGESLVGATYTPSDESGDARLFTQRLAALCEQQGVQFLYQQQIDQLVLVNQRISQVLGHDGVTHEQRAYQADAYVLALGSYSPLLAKPLGCHLAIYPAKGYSATYQVIDPILVPMVSLIDDAYKLVYSRLGDKLRVAGTAEFTGYDTTLSKVRCQAISERVAALFGQGVDISEPNYWTGLRPMTPSNVPIIGRAVNRQGIIDNLYLNTGHGTLGWTHANGSAKAITDIIAGKKPEIDFRFVGL